MKPDNAAESAGPSARPAPPGASPARRPKVSVGVPVFNGEKFLDEALASVAAQTLTDWELVICDNASTDGTEEIARRWVARDSRMRYERNPVNIGSDRNFNRCAELSSGEYFLTVAYDDRLAPEYLEKTAAVLDAEPDAVFCHSLAYEIDAEGRILREIESSQFLRSDRPHERFYNVLATVPDIIIAFGLLRMRTFRQTPMYITYPSSDAFLQAELSLRGNLRQVPERLFYRRLHPAAGHFVNLYHQFEESDPGRGVRIFFPECRRFGEYVRSVLRVPMSPAERLRCFRALSAYWRRRRLGYKIRKDLRMAAKAALFRASPRMASRVLTAKRRLSEGKTR